MIATLTTRLGNGRDSSVRGKDDSSTRKSAPGIGPHTRANKPDLELARGGSEHASQASKLLRDALTLLKELKIKQQVEQVHSRLRSLSRPKTALNLNLYQLNLPLVKRMCLQLVAQGKSNRQIAQELGIECKNCCQSPDPHLQ